MPHMATPSTMYFPRAIRVSFDLDLVGWAWLFAWGWAFTLRVASPRMTTIHAKERRSSVLKLGKNMPTLPKGWMSDAGPGLTFQFSSVRDLFDERHVGACRRRKETSKSATLGPGVHRNVEYTAKKFELLSRESGVMASNAVEPLPNQVPADDFQALEEKIYRTIELYKAARQAQATAERDAQRLREQLEEREEELARLRRETVQLKKEREDIRGRVEKMLAQIESLAEAS